MPPSCAAESAPGTTTSRSWGRAALGALAGAAVGALCPLLLCSATWTGVARAAPDATGWRFILLVCATAAVPGCLNGAVGALAGAREPGRAWPVFVAPALIAGAGVALFLVSMVAALAGFGLMPWDDQKEGPIPVVGLLLLLTVPVMAAGEAGRKAGASGKAKP